MARDPHRFRLTRAGVLNVWQYDEQVFDLADGRMLLRGTNGAGKSKTLEMLLPYVLDGDKGRMVATGGRGSPLLWLMSDGATGAGTRTGYLWVELARTDQAGQRHVVTCGIGLRHSASARQVTSWQFTVPCEAPPLTEPDGTPLSAPALRELVSGLGGQSFDAPRAYKEHVGQLLFGLGPQAYDDLLRLLYWLRQPQVGEDLDPRRLVEMLDEALPALDEQAVRQVGEALDDLAAHGERVERLAQAAAAVQQSAEVYSRYAATVLTGRAAAAREAERERASRSRAVTVAVADRDLVDQRLAAAEVMQREAGEALGRSRSRVQALESGPLARNQQVLAEKQRRAEELGRARDRAVKESERASERAEGSRARAADGSQHLLIQTGRVADVAGRLTAELRTCAVSTSLPSTDASNVGDLEPGSGAKITGAPVVGQAQGLIDRVPAVRALVGAARAAVTVVGEALTVLEARTRDREVAAGRAAEAEAREERAAGRLADADRLYDGLGRDWDRDARTWLRVRADLLARPDTEEPAGGPDAAGGASLLGASIDPETLAGRVAELVAPERARLTEDRAAAAADRVAAAGRVQEAGERRAAVLAERDPAPPAPVLPRPGRRGAEGLALWRLVDVVRDGADEPGAEQAVLVEAAQVEAALVEAALQASGLLDAQVLTDGTLRVGGEADTVLGVEAPVDGPSLADVLRPDVPTQSPVTADVVARLLASIALADTVSATDLAADDATARIGRDGTWRLGPLLGRAAKPVAQYLGSAARQAERARRLAEVDAAAEQAGRDQQHAEERERRARGALTELDRWLAAAPPTRALQEAAVRRDERAEQRDRAQADAAQQAAALGTAAREMSAAADALRTLGSEHDLPIERSSLDRRDRRLLELDLGLETLRGDAGRLLETARRVEEDGESAERDSEQAEQAVATARDARTEAASATQEAQALLETLGADVQRMQAELDQARREARTAQSQRDQAEKDARVLAGEQGQSLARLSSAQLRLAECLPALALAADAVTSLRDVPGFWVAALGRDLEPGEQDALDLLTDLQHPDADDLVGAARTVRVPRPAAGVLHGWAEQAVPRPADGNAVHADVRVLAAGPAADQEPRVVPVSSPRTSEPVLAVLARDAARAEQPLAIAAVTLAAEVTREKDLLTDRERTLFEEHLLGELGDALRSRRAEAGDLVRGMNELLSGVRTSQGIRVRLDWDLREDSGADVRDAVKLLIRARGSLTPDESVRLRDALSALIETERAAEPEQGYTEHLSRALDYRRWSAFTVRLSRPAVQGWTTLTRRTPLSQGEQKVVCYLPLFAAAAAHFTSVAGAAPYAPRLILLDDAFPKIDVRTHPLLFGLLVDLDLDFVLTSERLWGDFDTVPSLAVYEALRAPGERGIAQYRYTWDGKALTSVRGRSAVPAATIADEVAAP